ncbi:site-specific integrase [Pseudohoeflea suaedae]|uniref:Site-specific integrase n=1 Tax=Pseudohoeflea suaedae TaxID=877384 RepID=A0A4R5PPH0_9HYPH|nr:site-specific integrase [Pseudohoeflea suaedae]TDH38561.1 site-specific integrase [Pseudohoeflea suaedae]
MPKITKTFLDKQEPRDQPYIVWCSDLVGFGVRVFPSGRKVFYCDYRTRDTLQRRRMSIGAYGKLTVEEARNQARIVLGDAVKGEDPANERRTRRKSLTVNQLCDDYLDAAEKGLILGKGRRPKKPSTLYIDRGRIERHIRPLLGGKLVVDLSRADINKFVADVTTGKTAKVEKTGRLRGKSVVQGGAGTASRTTGLLSGILAYAVKNGVIDANPVHGVERPADGTRERRLSEEEYRAIGKALDAVETEPWQAVAAIRLLALTGCRRGEIESLKWSEVDFTGNALRFGDTKTGASTRPLSADAARVLSGLQRAADAVYVFPGTRQPDKPFGALQAAMGRIMASAELEGVTAHTLRHSFASVAADLNFTENTIGALLGHKSGTITSRYVHRLDSVLLEVANEVSGKIWRMMTAEPGKVVELPRRA